MRAIWKYTFPVVDSFALEMPLGAVVLAVQLQRVAPTMWARVDPEAPKVKEWFRIVGTGHLHVDNDRWRYVGTWQDGDLVWHLFHEAS